MAGFDTDTIDINTYRRIFDRNASYAMNYQVSGRELLISDKVQLLDN